jgi:hypothetical protein
MKILRTSANKQTYDSCITALPFHSWLLETKDQINTAPLHSHAK